MSRCDYGIFSEGAIANLSIKNRIVRSGTYEGKMSMRGRITDRMVSMYRGLAEGGAGMIVTGIMSVMLQGTSMPRQFRIYDDSFIDDIAPIADTVHRHGSGCKVIAQMAHAGRQVFLENRTARCVGPSDLPCPILKKKPGALSKVEVRDVAESFAEGIARAKKAGFDGAEIHAAHGYLLSSFLSPYTNRRSDEYGGSLENRVRIVRETLSLARDRVGDFPILIKVNSDDSVVGGIDSDNFPELARALEECGFDAIEVSGAIWDCLVRTEEELGFPPMPLPEARTCINTPDKQSYFLRAAEKCDVGVPVILAGGNRNVERLEKIIDGGKIDFISMARPFICEPDLPNRWLEGLGGGNSQCISCNACMFDLKYGAVKCMLKESRIKQRIFTRFFPRYWNLLFR